MARGWESKSVEMQLEERDLFRAADNLPIPDAAQKRELELLTLSRKRLVREIGAAVNPRYRAQKQLALKHIEAAMAALGGRNIPYQSSH